MTVDELDKRMSLTMKNKVDLNAILVAGKNDWAGTTVDI